MGTFSLKISAGLAAMLRRTCQGPLGAVTASSSTCNVVRVSPLGFLGMFFRMEKKVWGTYIQIERGLSTCSLDS